MEDPNKDDPRTNGQLQKRTEGCAEQKAVGNRRLWGSQRRTWSALRSLSSSVTTSRLPDEGGHQMPSDDNHNQPSSFITISSTFGACLHQARHLDLAKGHLDALPPGGRDDRVHDRDLIACVTQSRMGEVLRQRRSQSVVRTARRGVERLAAFAGARSAGRRGRRGGGGRRRAGAGIIAGAGVARRRGPDRGVKVHRA